MHQDEFRKSPSWLVFGATSIAIAAGVIWREDVRLKSALDDSRAEVRQVCDALNTERASSSALLARTQDLEHALGQTRDAQHETGADLESRLARIEARERALDLTVAGASDGARAVRQVADAEAAQVADLRRRLDAVAPEDFATLLAPTVKISSKSDVGSGTIVYSQARGERFVSYAITALHIVDQNWDAKHPVPLDVLSYVEGREVRSETGIVISVDQACDAALIEISSDRAYDAVARMIAPDHAADVRLHSRVHALGCPLGYAPMPSSGILTSKTKVLDGQTYWMINAPTIFGNSGGGIYLAETGEMIGILSRISAYKNLIDVAVPHMGIVTSMPKLYDWLSREHFQFLFDPHASFDDCDRARLAERVRASSTITPSASSVQASTGAAKPR